MEENGPSMYIKHILSLKAHKGNFSSGKKVNVIAIFPDKKHFVSGGSDNFIKLWDIDGLREVKRWIQESEDYIGEVTTLAIVDNNQFLSGGYDQEVKLWDKRRNEPLKRFFTGTRCEQIELSLDKKFFISIDININYPDQHKKTNGKIQLWDLESSTRIATPDDESFTSVIFFPSKVPSPDVLGEIILGKLKGGVEYWQIKKPDTSVTLEKISEAKKNLTKGSVDAIIYTPSSYPSDKGIFIARVKTGKGNDILKFEVKNNVNTDVNILKKTSTESRWDGADWCTGLAFAIFPDNKSILSQIGNSLCLWNSYSNISDWAPRRKDLFHIDPNVDKVSSIPNNICLNTIAILNNDMIFTGWSDGTIKIWSSHNYPLEPSTRSFLSSWMPSTVKDHMSGYVSLKSGDDYMRKVDGIEPTGPRGGMKKSKRVYKRSNRIVNKTRSRTN